MIHLRPGIFFEEHIKSKINFDECKIVQRCKCTYNSMNVQKKRKKNDLTLPKFRVTLEHALQSTFIPYVIRNHVISYIQIVNKYLLKPSKKEPSHFVDSINGNAIMTNHDKCKRWFGFYKKDRERKVYLITVHFEIGLVPNIDEVDRKSISRDFIIKFLPKSKSLHSIYLTNYLDIDILLPKYTKNFAGYKCNIDILQNSNLHDLKSFCFYGCDDPKILSSIISIAEKNKKMKFLTLMGFQNIDLTPLFSNPHLKLITIEINVAIDTIIKKIPTSKKAMIGNIRTLDLSWIDNEEIFDTLMSFDHYFMNLRVLKLQGMCFSYLKLVEMISKIKSLSTLFICTQVSLESENTKDHKYILNNVTELNISRGLIMKGEFNFLARSFPKIKYLGLNNSLIAMESEIVHRPLENCFGSSFSNVTNLNIINFCQRDMKERRAILSQLKNLKHLECLKVGSIAIRNKKNVKIKYSFDMFCNLMKLKKLVVLGDLCFRNSSKYDRKITLKVLYVNGDFKMEDNLTTKMEDVEVTDLLLTLFPSLEDFKQFNYSYTEYIILNDI